MVEPLQGIVVGTGDASKLKPALFVVSCGEGHLDLRTADKVRCVWHEANFFCFVFDEGSMGVSDSYIHMYMYM